MPSPRAESCRSAARWFLPTAALALAPKCLLCVAAYAGLGALLGIGGPEICGAPGSPPLAWGVRLATVAAGVSISAVLAVRQSRRLMQAKAPSPGGTARGER
jgi:hypothetical protein